MRLDKYLKVSRLIKRRTVANDACDAGRVMVNEKVVKASYDVKVGDVIEISFGNKSVKVKVTMIADSTKKEDAKEMFEYLDGLTTLDQAIYKIQSNTRRYCRKQLTWFKRDQSIEWFNPDNYEEIIKYIDKKLID